MPDGHAFPVAAAFAVVAAGGIGCIVAGAVADRYGRTTVTIGAMAASGSCAVACGLLFGAPAPIVFVVALVWGITVIADSAQFSSAVSELAPPGTSGSALSLQVGSAPVPGAARRGGQSASPPGPLWWTSRPSRHASSTTAAGERGSSGAMSARR